jgi:Big-like domain-containing protein
MFVMPERYIVMRPFTHNGTAYAPGEEFSANEAYRARNLDALVSRKFLIPDPDPHGRKAHFSRPTPVSAPAKMRIAMEHSTPAVEVIVIEPAYPEVTVGGTVQLTATLYPPGSEGTVVWSSGDEADFTVDQTGLVTGVAPGGNYAYANVEGAPYPGQVPVTVNAPATIVTNQEDCVIEQIGWSVNIWCWVDPTDSSAVYTWTVADPSIAHVVPSPPSNADVYIYGDAEGSTTVEISTVTNGQTVTKTIPITVLEALPTATVTVNPSATNHPAGVGDFLLTATVSAGTQQVTWEADPTLFALTPDAMGPMSCGVAPITPTTGTFLVTAKWVDNPECYADCSVTLDPMADPASLEAEAPPKPKRGRPTRGKK